MKKAEVDNLRVCSNDPNHVEDKDGDFSQFFIYFNFFNFFNFTFYFLVFIYFVYFILLTKWCEMIKAEEKILNQSEHRETKVSGNKLAKLKISLEKSSFKRFQLKNGGQNEAEFSRREFFVTFYQLFLILG